MASSVDFILNLNGDQARKVLLDLHRQGNNLFSQKGYDLRLNSKGFNRSLDQATDRVLSFTAATTIFSTVGLAMRRLASDAITVETSIAQIQSILNATSSDLSGFTDSLFKLANKTGVGFSDAAKAAEEFSRQGLTLEKTLKATEAALSLARVSGGNLEKTVGNLVAITSAFANEALVYEEVADTLGALDAAFSTTTTGLAEGLSRVSAVANSVGVSFKEMSALIASTKQVTGRSEAVIGNAFKSIFTNIGTDKVQEELRAIGVETRNLDGTFIDAEKVIASLADRYDELTDAQRANISFKVAGKYNKNILEGAIFAQNQGVSEKAVNVAENAAGSIAERLVLLNNTTATSLQTLQNSITQLSTGSVGGLFTELTKEAATFAQKFVDGVVGVFAEGNPVGKAIAGGIAGILKGPVLVIGLTLIGKLIQKVGTDLLRAGKSVLFNNGAFQSQKGILVQINNEIAKGNMLLAQRSSLATSQVAGMKAPVKPNINDPRYQTVGRTTAYPSTKISKNYLQDRASYNRQVAAASAQTAAQAQAVKSLSVNQGRQVLSAPGPTLPLIQNYRGVGFATRGKRGRASKFEKDRELYRQQALPFSTGRAKSQLSADNRERSLLRVNAAERGRASYVDRNQTPLSRGLFIGRKEESLAVRRGLNRNSPEAIQRTAEARRIRSEKIKTGTIGAAFAAPLLGSFAEQSIGGGAGKIAGSIGEGVGIAALGAAFGGPFTIAITSAIGLLKVFGTVTEVAFGDFEQLNKVLKDSVGEIEKNIQAGSAYIAAQRDYNDALKSGDAALIVKTAKELTSAGQNLKGDRRGLLTISDPEKQQQLIGELDKTSESLANASLAAITANNLVAKSYEGTFDKLKSLAGFKKTFSQSEISEAAGAIGRGIDPNSIKDISGIQSRFGQTGNSQEIQDIIGQLAAETPELSDAFKTVASQGKRATEQLSIATLAYIANQKVTNDLTEGQKNAQKTLSDLNKAFKVSISRASMAREELTKDQFSSSQTQIGVRRILGGESDGIEGIRSEQNFSIQELESKTKSDVAQLQQTLIKGVEDAVEKSTDIESKIKGKDFIEKIAQEGYDFANFLKDFSSSVGDSGFIDVKDVNVAYVNGLKEAVNATKREVEASKRLTAAREAVEKRKLSATAFGPLTGDQTDSRNVANAGRAAENKILSFYKNPVIGKKSFDVITDQEAEDVLLKAEQERSSGRKPSGNRLALLTAARKRIELSSGIEAKTVIGEKIQESISENSAFNKARGLSDPNQRGNIQITKQIQEQVSKGNFGKAEELAGGLNVKDNSGVIAVIKEQADKAANKIQSAEDYVAELMGDAVAVPLNENTTATNANTAVIEKWISAFSKTTASSGAMSNPVEGNAARAAKAAIIAKELNTNVIAPLAVKGEQQATITEAQAGLMEFLEKSKEGTATYSFGQQFMQGADMPKASMAQAERKDYITPKGLLEGYNKSLGYYEKLPGLAGYKTTEEERRLIPEIYNNPEFKTAEERRGGFSAAFGENRGDELFSAAEEFTNKNKKLEGVSISDSKDLEKDIRFLRIEEQRAKSRLESINMQNKAAEEASKAAQSIEASAKSMESAASLISKGTEQNFTGLLDVAFSGADFLQNNNVVAELESTFKRLFIQYRKEETGKEPALAPTSPRTAVA